MSQRPTINIAKVMPFAVLKREVASPALSTSSSMSSTYKPHRKRERLTGLSPNEKLERRKLKNRVAAQVARDKKKARLEELELIVGKLRKEVITNLTGSHCCKVYSESIFKIALE